MYGKRLVMLWDYLVIRQFLGCCLCVVVRMYAGVRMCMSFWVGACLCINLGVYV